MYTIYAIEQVLLQNTPATKNKLIKRIIKQPWKQQATPGDGTTFMNSNEHSDYINQVNVRHDTTEKTDRDYIYDAHSVM